MDNKILTLNKDDLKELRESGYIYYSKYVILTKEKYKELLSVKKEERERIILIMESRQNESVIDIVKDLKMKTGE